MFKTGTRQHTGSTDPDLFHELSDASKPTPYILHVTAGLVQVLVLVLVLK